MSKIKSLVLGLATVVLVSPWLATADGGYDMMGETGGMWNGGFGWCGAGYGMMGWGGGLVMLLVIVFLVTGIVYFWQEINKNKRK